MTQVWYETIDGSWKQISTEQNNGDCTLCGDSSDGMYNNGGVAITTIGGDNNYSEIEIPSWQTANCTGSSPLIIRSETEIVIEGIIDLSGEDATTSSYGSGSCGGYGGGGPGGDGSGPGGGNGISRYTAGAGQYAVDTGYEWWLMSGYVDTSKIIGSGGEAGNTVGMLRLVEVLGAVLSSGTCTQSYNQRNNRYLLWKW